MFTVEQIKEKLAKVRTGADYPLLAKELRDLGITFYETRLEDGRSVYHGADGSQVVGGPNYDPIGIAEKVNADQLRSDVLAHQQGKSDYFQISRQCADSGIEKWAVCLVSMTCAYVDRAGNRILVENIPEC
jgi:uncharacterized protein YbcV (DUF1398 family)